MDKISVIVPVYNVEKYLDKCVESIVNQTYKNLEIILVDDGSTDNCPEICDEWAKKDNRIKVIHKPNGGLSSARNAGMDSMTGSYIQFVDSDDYIKSNMIEVMYGNIIKGDYDVCVCNYSFIDESDNVISATDFKKSILKGDEIMPNFLKTTVFNSWNAWTKMYKYSVVEKYNLRYDETIKWGEDYPFNYLYFKSIDKMIAIDDVLYNYLSRRNGSITCSMNSGQANRWKFIKKLVIAERDNSINYKIALSQYASALMCIAREVLRTGDKAFIDRHFNEIVTELETYYNDFMSLSDLNKKIRFSIKLIHFCPGIFKTLYQLFLKLQ